MPRPLRLQLVSDVHFEFHIDDGATFVDRLVPTGVDVLVAAGDLCAGDQIEEALTALCRRYPQVVYVMGNHEHYDHDLDDLRELREDLQLRLPNLSWLDHSSVTIDGVRFCGTTLWFPDTPDNDRYARFLSDYERIPRFRDWLGHENGRAVAFLEREVGHGDVVITHHLPTPASITPQWQGSPLNRFFLTDLDALIRTRQPVAWLHGHTHDTCDHRVGDTRVLCNPYGYEPDELNPDFMGRFLLAVPRNK